MANIRRPVGVINHVIVDICCHMCTGLISGLIGGKKFFEHCGSPALGPTTTLKIEPRSPKVGKSESLSIIIIRFVYQNLKTNGEILVGICGHKLQNAIFSHIKLCCDLEISATVTKSDILFIVTI